MMFLNADELTQLTGCKTAGYQCRWLKRNGWKFERAANGKPVVLRSYVENRLSDHNKHKDRGLNMAALRG